MASNVTYHLSYRCTAWLTQCHWTASPIVYCRCLVLKCKSHIASWDNSVRKNTNSGNLFDVTTSAPTYPTTPLPSSHWPSGSTRLWSSSRPLFLLNYADPEHLFDGKSDSSIERDVGAIFLLCAFWNTQEAAHRVCVHHKFDFFSVDSLKHAALLSEKQLYLFVWLDF